MPKYRSGAAAIDEAATSSKGGSSFKPFVPEIFWKEADEKKYILVLSPIDEVAVLDLHEFIKLPDENRSDGFRYESFLSRKDPMIEEDYDKIEDDLGRKSKTRIMGAAVELVPVMETIKGRKRPTSFAVKTEDFKRNTDDGEEIVTFPKVGLIVQSSQLMWSPLKSLDESQGPLEELPLEIIRRIPGGQKSNTQYEFIPFMDIPVDLSAVTEYVDGISYLTDVLEELVPEMEAADDDLGAAQAVARALVTKRIDELASSERYEELLGDIDELEAPPWEAGKKKSETKAKTSKARPSRPSPRKRVQHEEESEQKEVEETNDEDPTPEAKSDKFAKLKERLEPKA